MCGRYSIAISKKELRDIFRVELPEVQVPLFNLAPTQLAPIIRMGESGDLEMTLARWGFVPRNAISLESIKKLSLFNARDDRLEISRVWDGLLETSRCLVPASSFIEFAGEKGAKRPVNIGLSSGRPFGMAGLWSRWERDGRLLESFTVITTRANTVVAPWHERMPVIVKPLDYEAWLDPSLELEDARAMLRPYPASHMALNGHEKGDPQVADF